MKKIITILIVIVVVSIIIICGILLKVTNNKDEHEIQEIIEDPDDLELSAVKIDNIVKVVGVRNEYYIVKNCITKYYLSFIEMCQNKDMKSKESIQMIYGLLDKRYIEFKQITTDNLTSKLTDIKNDISVNIKDMYMCQKSDNVAAYFVYGTLMNKSNFTFSDFSIMVNVDMLNRTFSICLDDYIKNRYDVVKLEDNIKLEIPDVIEENIYNKFDYKHISDVEYINDLYEQYKNNTIYNKEKAYECLDEEYKNARFKNLEDYIEYVKSNIRKIITAELNEYEKTKCDEYTQYVVQDNYGNYYIFRETATMKYTLLLDTYSIDIPEFIEKYDSTTVQGKVVLNIQKIIEALNAKDISYIYSNLAESFKNNKFKTEKSLKQYIEKHLNSNYDVEYDSFKNEGETYIYDIILQDKSTENETIKMQIIMQLLEDRNFVMSFSIES